MKQLPVQLSQGTHLKGQNLNKFQKILSRPSLQQKRADLHCAADFCGNVALPARQVYFRAGSNIFGCFSSIAVIFTMPISSLMPGFIRHAFQIHIGQSKHDCNQENRQHNANACHAALPAVNLVGDRNQVEVVFHFRLAPNSFSTPSDILKMRSAALA